MAAQNTKLLTIFVGIAAVALLMLGIAFVVMAVVAVRLEKKVTGTIDEVKLKAMPILSTTESLLRDLTPKIKVVTENIVETSHVVRTKVQEFNGTLTEINGTITDLNQKTRAQVGKVDVLVSTTMGRTAAITDTLYNGIRKPMTEVAGVVNGFKAGLDVLLKQGRDFSKPRTPREPHS